MNLGHILNENTIVMVITLIATKLMKLLMSWKMAYNVLQLYLATDLEVQNLNYSQN